MKKLFIYAAIASVAFASCSKDNGVELPSNNEENEAKQLIELRMSSSIDVTTRGSGAVGGTEAEGDNSWNGQTLNVYMLEKGTMIPAFNEATNASYFENAEVKAPNTGATGTASYGAEQYYPSSGNFDFFAYHGDDAVADAPVLNAAGDAYTVGVIIDGTQDLMVAKAGLNLADSTTYESNAKYDYKRIYSAYSARRGVQPRFAFNHLLSRFVFQAVAVEESAAGANGIKITKVEVKAPEKGVMTVAAVDENDLGVEFSTDSAMFTLKNGAAPMDTRYLEYNKLVRLGESMLLPAGGTKYIAEITYEQKMLDGTVEKSIHEATIALKDNKPFVAGTQYKVNVSVYGFRQIVLTCDLIAWEEGEDIPVDSEE